MGNLRSVERAVRALGFPCEVHTELTDVESLIIPGVGAFGTAMRRLSSNSGRIADLARSGCPILGICLGMQVLFESSDERGAHSGLGLLPGRVRYLPHTPGVKVPHVGWNAVSFRGDSSVCGGQGATESFYFVHSLYADCSDRSLIEGECTHGIGFPAAVRRRNVWGVQFHPEKSGEAGLALLDRFLRCS